jgi:hypothetical protein
MVVGFGAVEGVVVPIRVVARGRVRAGPARLLGDESWVVFVLDPYPDSSGARLAHACEVVCGRRDVAVSVLQTVHWGEVQVSGQLVLEEVTGPIEDDLSAVRVWIKASSVAPVQPPPLL